MPYADKKLYAKIVHWQRKFNDEEFRAARRIWSRDYRKRNQICCNNYCKKWINKNREHVRQRDKLRYRRRKTNLNYRLYRAIRDRVRCALKKSGLRKRKRGIQLLGCTASEYRQYLEALFLPGMSWANRSLWHIDHKKPISSFDLSSEEGQRAAFHYTNTQPLWAIDNLRKGAKVA